MVDIKYLLFWMYTEAVVTEPLFNKVSARKKKQADLKSGLWTITGLRINKTRNTGQID